MSTRVMGILNVTPDSFSDGGRFAEPDAAIAAGLDMFASGAALVDVGGESTRPGATPVDVATEIARVVPVIAELSRHGRVSVDTRNAGTAEAAIEAGATVLNDVSASLAPVAAAAGVTWIAMHMRGDPTTMAELTDYEDVVAEVVGYLADRVEQAAGAGVPEVWIDPGLGFAKTAPSNLSLLRHLDRLVAVGVPVVVGASRKSFLGAVTAAGGVVPGPEDRLEPSLAAAVWAATQGAAWVRVHDVSATVRALRVVHTEVSAA